jgi:hypothetical protein
MLYNEARELIRSGDLLAFTHRSWKSWYDIKIQLVRIFTRSEYSHVGLAWVVGGRVFILEAVSPLVRIYPLSVSGDFYLFPMKANWNSAAEEYALSKVGYAYSQVAAVMALFNEVEEDQTNECAAYVISVFKRLNIDLGKRAIPSSVVQEALNLGASSVFVKGF